MNVPIICKRNFRYLLSFSGFLLVLCLFIVSVSGCKNQEQKDSDHAGNAEQDTNQGQGKLVLYNC